MLVGVHQVSRDRFTLVWWAFSAAAGEDPPVVHPGFRLPRAWGDGDGMPRQSYLIHGVQTGAGIRSRTMGWRRGPEVPPASGRRGCCRFFLPYTSRCRMQRMERVCLAEQYREYWPGRFSPPARRRRRPPGRRCCQTWVVALNFKMSDQAVSGLRMQRAYFTAGESAMQPCAMPAI